MLYHRHAVQAIFLVYMVDTKYYSHLKMVICQYFLRGTCKFGNNCKNQHYYGDSYNANQMTSVLRQNQTYTSPNPINDKTLIESVINDMVQLEHGHQWLFSSYSPFKEKPPFPEFQDKTFEEVRFEFYSAEKSGSTDIFKQEWKDMCQNAILRVRALQNPSPAIINILKDIYYNKTGSTNNAIQTPIQSFPNQLPFEYLAQQPFQQTQSLFQQAPLPFHQQSQSVYQQQQQQPFQQPQSIFETHQLQQPQSPFQMQQHPFQQIPNQSSMIQQTIVQEQKYSVNNENSSFYSTIEQLTPEEKAAYESSKFIFGCIPEKPPTLLHIKN